MTNKSKHELREPTLESTQLLSDYRLRETFPKVSENEEAGQSNNQKR